MVGSNSKKCNNNNSKGNGDDNVPTLLSAPFKYDNSDNPRQLAENIINSIKKEQEQQQHEEGTNTYHPFLTEEQGSGRFQRTKADFNFETIFGSCTVGLASAFANIRTKVSERYKSNGRNSDGLGDNSNALTKGTEENSVVADVPLFLGRRKSKHSNTNTKKVVVETVTGESRNAAAAAASGSGGDGLDLVGSFSFDDSISALSAGTLEEMAKTLELEQQRQKAFQKSCLFITGMGGNNSGDAPPSPIRTVGSHDSSTGSLSPKQQSSKEKHQNKQSDNNLIDSFKNRINNVENVEPSVGFEIRMLPSKLRNLAGAAMSSGDNEAVDPSTHDHENVNNISKDAVISEGCALELETSSIQQHDKIMSELSR